jgi:hypothetical protein
MAAVQQIPPDTVPGSSPVFPGLLGAGRPGWGGSEAGFAGGDADPDVDGRDLALAVPLSGRAMSERRAARLGQVSSLMLRVFSASRRRW